MVMAGDSEARLHDLNSLQFPQRRIGGLTAAKQEAIAGERDYPVLAALAEKVGCGPRGNTPYQHPLEGEELTRAVEAIKTISVNGRKAVRTLRRKERSWMMTSRSSTIAAARFGASSRSQGHDHTC